MIAQRNEILAKGFLIPSKGDKHWLGDGYYFYKEEEYAFRWILLQYASGFKDDYKEYYKDTVPEHYKQFIEDYQSIKREKVSTTGLYTNKTGNNKIYKFRKK